MTGRRLLAAAALGALGWEWWRSRQGADRQRTELRLRLEERTRALSDANVELQRQLRERRRAEAILRRSEAQFRTMAEVSPLAIYVWAGMEQRAVYANPTFGRLFGYTIEEVPTVAHWWPLAYPEEGYRDRIFAEWERRLAVAQEGPAGLEPLEAVVTCKDGSERHVIWGYQTIGEQGWAFGLDVTELRRHESALRESEAKYRVVFDNSPDAFLILGTGDVFVDCNRAAERMLRGNRQRIIGQPPAALSPARQPDGRTSAEAARTILAEAPHSGQTSFEWVHRRFDGSDVVVDVSMAPIRWESQEAWFITWRDATERKRVHTELQERATTDPLTGAVNRQEFVAQAAEEVRRARRLGHPLTVAVLDLDHFKEVNDRYGHAIGDQALLAFTDACRTSIRDIDTFGRLGGDEFALLLPGSHVDQACHLLDRIRTALAECTISVDGVPVALTVSSGVAGWREGGDSLDHLLERADQAMYEAKQSGRDRVVAASTADPPPGG